MYSPVRLSLQHCCTNHIAVAAYFSSQQLLHSGLVENTRSSVIVKIETHSISVAQNYLSERLLKLLWGLSQCITHTLPWSQNTTFDLHSHGGYAIHLFLLVGVVQDRYIAGESAKTSYFSTLNNSYELICQKTYKIKVWTHSVYPPSNSCRISRPARHSILWCIKK